MKLRLPLIAIVLLVPLVLLPLARQPAKADAVCRCIFDGDEWDCTPYAYEVDGEMRLCSEGLPVRMPYSTSTPYPTSAPSYHPYPAPGDCEQDMSLSSYPAPEVNKIGALEHKTCVIIPWLTRDGWRKREVCFPNR